MMFPRRLLQEHVDTLDELRKKAAAHDYFKMANAELTKKLSDRDISHERATAKAWGRYQELERQFSLIRSANEKLRGKLQRRSRELGIQRAEVKKIDAMFNEAVLGSTQHEYAAATATFMEKSYLQLAERLEKERAVLHRLALIHFTEDEIAKALDDGHIVVDA